MTKTNLGILFVLGCAALLAFGCQSTEPPKAQEMKDGSLMPVTNPKERLEAQRLAAGMRGLDASGSTIKALTDRRDRPAAIKLTRLAEAKMQTENVWFESIGRFRDAILADSTYAPAYEGLSRACLMEGKSVLAEKALNTALGLDSRLVKARYGLAQLQQAKGDYAGAVSVWKGVVAQDPGYSDTWARMAIASYFAENYAAAWNYLGEAERRGQDVPSQFKGLLKEVAPKP